MAKPLTPKQQRFVEEYLADPKLNATQAAIRAGYSEHTAKEIGAENLTKPHVAAAIREAMDKRSQAVGLTAERVLRELERVAFSDPRKMYRPDGTLKPPGEWDDDTAAAIAGVEVEEVSGTAAVDGRSVPTVTRTTKVKRWDKNVALINAMRHLGLLNDKLKVEHTGKGGGPIRYADTTDADLDAEIKRLQGV